MGDIKNVELESDELELLVEIISNEYSLTRDELDSLDDRGLIYVGRVGLLLEKLKVVGGK